MTHPLVDIEAVRRYCVSRHPEGSAVFDGDWFTGPVVFISNDEKEAYDKCAEMNFINVARVLLSAEPTEGMVVAVNTFIGSIGIRAANAALLAELTKPHP